MTLAERLVVVTDAHELAALGAIRSLGRAGYRVLATAPSEANPSSRVSRYIDRFDVHPDPWKQQRAFSDWLLGVVRRCGPLFVLPISEASIVAAATHREAIAELSILLAPTQRGLSYSLSKYHASKAAVAAGLRIPNTVFVSSGADEWQTEGLEHLSYPVVVKTDNVLLSADVYDKGRTRIVDREDKVHLLLEEAREHRRGVIVQECIPGSGVGAFFLRANGEVLMDFAHERVHEVPYTGGWSAVRRSVRDPQTLAAGAKLLESIDYDGVAMVEFRRVSGSEPFFMEVNGRLWGSLALALHAGRDFPAAWASCRGLQASQVRSKPFQRPEANGLYCSNRYPGELGYLLSVLRSRHARPNAHAPAPPSTLRAVGEVLRYSFDPRVRHDHFWWSDPAPGIKQGWKCISDVAVALRSAVLRKVRARSRKRLLSKLEHAFLQRGEPRKGARSNLLFVCYGNICRSPVASALAKQLLPEAAIVSAGFHPEEGRATPSNVIVAARRVGLNMQQSRSQRLTPQMIDAADYVFVMDLANYRDLLSEFPGCERKVLLLGAFASQGGKEISDPYGWSATETLAVIDQISDAVRGLREWLQVSPAARP